MSSKTFKSKRTGRQITLVWGGGFTRFGLGFNIDTMSIALDLGFAWVAVEY